MATKAAKNAATEPQNVEGQERPEQVTPEEMEQMERPIRPESASGTGSGELSAAQIRESDQTIKELLAAQQKVPIRLYQVPPDSTDKKLPDEFVQINGHAYLIQRGVDVMVPEAVRDVLVQAGRY